MNIIFEERCSLVESLEAIMVTYRHKNGEFVKNRLDSRISKFEQKHGVALPIFVTNCGNHAIINNLDDLVPSTYDLRNFAKKLEDKRLAETIKAEREKNEKIINAEREEENLRRELEEETAQFPYPKCLACQGKNETIICWDCWKAADREAKDRQFRRENGETQQMYVERIEREFEEKMADF